MPLIIIGVNKSITWKLFLLFAKVAVAYIRRPLKTILRILLFFLPWISIYQVYWSTTEDHNFPPSN